MKRAGALISVALLVSCRAFAADDPSVAACQATGLAALQQISPDTKDLIFDQESLAISAADTKVENVPVKTVILGQAYIKRGDTTGKPDRFVCLIGEKGKVLLTFFTSK
jgi:hypothetical protein